MDSARLRRSMLTLVAAALCSLAAMAQEPRLIDVHVHFQMAPTRDPAGSARSAVQNMARFNISQSVLMPPPYPEIRPRIFYDIEDVSLVQREHPGKFLLVGGSRLNVMIHTYQPDQVDESVRSRFRKTAEEILARGAVGFGEIAIHHVSIPAMGSQHAYERVSALHPLLQLLADIARENDVPIDIHFDAVPQDMALPGHLRPNPNNPAVLLENLDEFRQFLSRNSNTKIIWSHVGFEPLLTRSPDRVAALLKKFPNLYMSFRLNRGAPRPAAAMTPDGQVKPRWIELIESFPDRFLLGSDAFYDSTTIARGATLEGFENLRTLISSLDEPAKSAVAYKNAERLFKLH